jgi:sec-independent protein translocase protein TatB
MFDMSWSELLVIVVVAVVVVGPKDLPRLMRTAGQWAGRARSMADQFRRSFDDMARQTELDELRREVQKLKDTPLTAKDYVDLGIPDNPLPSAQEMTAAIEDVGAAPPRLDPAPQAEPIATPATSQQA